MATDIAELLRVDRARDDARRERNRQTMPGVAALVDEVSAVFGQVKVRWAKEGDHEIGVRDSWSAA